MTLSLCLARCFACAMLFAAVAWAQERPALEAILERLERVEKENRALAEEIRALREQLAAHSPSPAPITERMEVQERRVEEHAQTKVEAAEKLPVTLEGMVLMNAFVNTQPTGGAENPTILPAVSAQARNYGATLRQSTLGLRYRGASLAGGTFSGSISLDLFGGSTNALNHTLRLRTATVQIEWGSRRLMIGLLIKR